MPDETPKPPAVKVVDFRANARAAYAANATKTPVVEVKPALPEAPKPVAPNLGIGGEEPPEVKPEGKVEPEKVKPPSDSIAKSFEKLAVEREGLRKERAEFEAAQKELAAVKAAMTNKDPRALLALAGMTHADYVAAWTGKELPADEAPAEKPATPAPEVSALQKRLDQLESQLRTEREGQAEMKVTAALLPKLKEFEAEFPLAAKFGEDSVKEALQIMKDHFVRTKSTLSDDPVESLKIALSVIEERHQATVSKYGLLTSKPAAAKVAPEAPGGSPRVESVALTNGDESSSPAVKTKPMTPADYRAQALGAYRKHTPPAG